MLIQTDPLRELTAQIFAAAGCDRSEADCIARHLVDSNLCGFDSHGVIRIMQYVDNLRQGTVRLRLAARHREIRQDYRAGR